MDSLVTILAVIVWENFGQPILDSAKNEYGDRIFNGLKSSLPFKKNENEIIEAEIIEAVDTKIITDEESLIEFLEKNSTLIEALNDLKKTKSTTDITNAFKNITNSTIKINGNNKKIDASFDGISDSVIEV